MTAERRLAKLEAGLSPTQLVVRWLDEAHAFGGLEAYTRALLDEPPERYPLNRLLREAVAGVRTANPKLRGEALDKPIRTALRETAFWFELVLAINTTTDALVEREVLLHGLIAANLALVANQARPDPRQLEHLRSCLGIARGRVVELRASQEARTTVEARYLAGHLALFPDGLAAFEAQLAETTELADLARRLADLDDLRLDEPDEPEAVSQRAAALVVDLVEPARATALERLDEGRGAMTFATAWVRQKLVRGGQDEAESPPL